MFKALSLESSDELKFQQEVLLGQFENLIKEVNSILFYLSNVEFQMNPDDCVLFEPIEVIYSMNNTFRWHDSLKPEFLTPNRERRMVVVE